MLQLLGNRSEIRSRLGYRRARLEPAHDHQTTTAAIGEREMRPGHIVLHHHRRPYIDRGASVRAAEFLRCDADNAEVVLVQGYRSPDDVWIGAKVSLPQSIADHHDRMRIRRPILFGRSEERRVGKECRSRWSPYH